jgi:hypothetical protein
MPRAAKLYNDAVPMFGIVSCAILALSLTPWVIATGTGVLLVGMAVRALLLWGTARPA